MTVRPLPSRLVLLGHPVAQSLSPTFQNAALRKAGLPITYAAMDVAPAELPRVLGELRSEGAGGNVTYPHKRAVAAACDHVTATAARVGAVNTFWVQDGALHGDNTDVGGFSEAADRLLGLRADERWPERVALLGGGGAAAAVLAAAERRGVLRVDVHVRRREQGAELASRFPIACPAGGAIDPGVGLVVNATPVGMRGDEVPLPPEAIPPGAAVLDLVYRVGETPWVHACRARGHRAADGVEMLLAQGALAFERWTGVAPDRAVMRAALGAR